MKSPEILVVEAFVSAINRHDLAELSRLMAPDHTFIDPTGRVISGREQMIGGWDYYFRMFGDYEISVEKMVSDGPVVAVFGQARGTFSGRNGPRPENLIAMPAAWQAKVEGGQLVVWQAYADWTEGSKIMAREAPDGSEA